MTESVVLSVAPVAVKGLPRLIQFLEFKSELYCNLYIPPASVLQVRYYRTLMSLRAHYAGAPPGLAFDLLNEPKDAATTLVFQEATWP